MESRRYENFIFGILVGVYMNWFVSFMQELSIKTSGLWSDPFMIPAGLLALFPFFCVVTLIFGIMLLVIPEISRSARVFILITEFSHLILIGVVWHIYSTSGLMFFTGFGLCLTVVIWGFSFYQKPPMITFPTLDDVITKIDALSEQVENLSREISELKSKTSEG